MKKSALAFVCCMSAACTHQVTSVRSAWYVMEEQGIPVTYISVLNQGNTSITPKEIILNPLRQRTFSNDFHSGWHAQFAANQPISPGKILYIRARDIFQGKTPFEPCMVPIEINIRIEERSSLVISQLDVAMPNAVPIGWEAACMAKMLDKS
jgi:hypothetical protein